MRLAAGHSRVDLDEATVAGPAGPLTNRLGADRSGGVWSSMDDLATCVLVLSLAGEGD